MGKYIALGLFLAGVSSLLYQWVQMQKCGQHRIENFLLFLQKSQYAMERENIRLISYLKNYESGDTVINAFLEELGSRLEMNQYPCGELAWQEVLIEQREKWGCDEETFSILLNASHGFFSGSRKENLCFLQKSIREFEQQLKVKKEKDMQDRKVWLPVGMLGSLMVVILFL